MVIHFHMHTGLSACVRACARVCVCEDLYIFACFVYNMALSPFN